MTNEEIESNNDIPTSEIHQDIEITRIEIEQYEIELKALRGNPQENRVQIFFREGKVKIRQNFIAKLTEILKYRNSKTQNTAIK